MGDSGWTIDEFAAQVAAVLAGDGADQPSRRVRSVPDRRAIRWYTTIGLLDRPRLRGRTGWYHRRHLLQLVAVKRLQAAGMPLAEIQAELAGADDATLRRIARLPDERLDSAPQPAPVAASTRPRFWSARAEAPSTTDTGSRPVARVDGAQVPGSLADATYQAGLRYAIDLGGGVTVLLDGAASAPNPHDVAAVRRAAEPLLDQLTRRGLARVVPDEEPEGESR